MKSANPASLALKTPAQRSRDEQAFLPAALEIVETPIAPYANYIGGSIIALFCIALAWASFGQIDIVARHPRREKSFQAAAPRSFSPLKPAWCAQSTYATDKRSKRVTCCD